MLLNFQTVWHMSFTEGASNSRHRIMDSGRNRLRVLLTLIGCLLVSTVRADVEECRNWFAALQTRAQLAGIQDAGSIALPGYPWLRSNRWLAFLQQQVNSDAAGEQWMALASREGLAHWRAVMARLDDKIEPDPKLEECVYTLTEFSAFPGVPDTAVPDAYSTLQRVLGLYPLTRLVAQPSIDNYRREMRARFQRPLRRPLRYYRPAPFIGAPPPPSELSVNPLEVPNPGEGATRAMLSHYAPIIAVADESEANLPGTIELGQAISVNTESPVAYTWLSWTHYLGHNLLQLNYQFWFPERPPASRMDIYSGKLDGLIWRVTLKPDGNVLYYDSIHPCGCYHKVYPVARGLRESGLLLDGPVFYNRLAPNANQQAVVLHLEPDTHYVVAVGRAAEQWEDVPVFGYGYLPADRLRALPGADGKVRSLFNGDGLIAGTERRERWLLWPLGVPSAGAMRQAGNHAIAFVGKRHFDDARLPAMMFAPPAPGR